MGKINASLKVRSDLKNLTEIRSFIEKATAKAGLSEEGISGIRLAVDETCANIILHGYGEEDGEITISVTWDNEKVIVTVNDDAPPYNPFEEVLEPDLTVPLEQRPLGGMGIFLVKQHSDSVEYKVTESGGNELILTKFCPDRTTAQVE